MLILDSVYDLLTHIKEVQKDAIGLSSDSLLMISNFIESNNIEIDDNVASALQYQDVISQQLTAIMEAIDSVQENIDKFNHSYKTDEDIAVDSMNKLQEKLSLALGEAKDKKDRFSGKFANNHADEEEIEFF
ncbi:MAG: hypothetical protein KAS26_07545 [Sulfurimonas sp.]|nr:hypothetical protein [Sulfurimonas sp.]